MVVAVIDKWGLLPKDGMLQRYLSPFLSNENSIVLIEGEVVSAAEAIEAQARGIITVEIPGITEDTGKSSRDLQWLWITV